MKRLSNIDEAIEYIDKFQSNYNIYGIILHRNPSTNIRTILGVIRCNHFSIKHSKFDVCISLYSENSRNSFTYPKKKSKKEDQPFSDIKWKTLEAKIGNKTFNNAVSAIVNLCLPDLRIINITDYSADFITSSGFDFSYVTNKSIVELNLLNEWVFEKNRMIKAFWVRPDVEDVDELREDLVFKKKEMKDRHINID